MTTTGKARDNIRLRNAPSFDAPEIGFINVTKEVEIVGVEGDWLRVVWNEKEGYVARKFILPADPDALDVMAANPTPPSLAAAEDDQPAAPARPKKPARPKTSVRAKP
ncbi:MAG: SH3 domain-containing protein [Anaerolineales bacterium]|nr:SH3 domain-containing protein [Anaerolineales bacterium]